MTRPIFEPSTPRQFAKQGYGQNQLFRRPAPSGSEVNVVAIMYHGNIGPVPSGAWTSVVVNDDYDEADVSDPDAFANFSADVTDGCIRAQNGGFYLADGWARIEDAPTIGNQFGVALDFGNGCVFATFRVGSQFTADGFIEDTRCSVSTVFLNPQGVVGPDSVRLLVYHNEGMAMEWGDARLSLTYITGPAVTIYP